MRRNNYESLLCEGSWERNSNPGLEGKNIEILHRQAALEMQTGDLAIFIHALTKIFNIFRCFKEMKGHEF